MTIYADGLTYQPVVRSEMGSSFRHRRLVIAGHVVFDPIALARPAMRPAEIATLTALMRRSSNMLEFGAGGSTTLAVKLGISHLVSVESDAAWIERLQSDNAAARAEEQGRLQLLRADIGPIGFLGGPGKGSEPSLWPEYARTPWGHVDARQLDLVLVDGRFRVACILETVLRVEHRTLIAVHDFWNRPAYHVALPFLDEIGRCQTLGLFRAKVGVDRTAATALLEKACYWPR